MRCSLGWLVVFCTLVGCGPKTAHEFQAGEAPSAPALSLPPGPPAEAQAEAARKIIYRAEVRLVVDDLTKFESQFADQLRRAGGVVADFHEDRALHKVRQASWTVRIPSVKFSSLLETVGELGRAELRRSTADDVTEQFVDLDARLKNEKKLEARLLEIVAQKTGELEDLLKAEKELSRVRQEIERMEGQLRVMQDRIALSTIVVHVREGRDYLPAAEATLAGRLHAAFFDSVALLLRAGEELLIAVVSAGPWVGIALVVILPCWLLARRRRQRTA